MARTAGALSHEATGIKYPKDVKEYIKKIKIPLLVDMFCTDVNGNITEDKKEKGKQFMELFSSCKSKTDADRVANRYIKEMYSVSIPQVPIMGKRRRGK